MQLIKHKYEKNSSISLKLLQKKRDRKKTKDKIKLPLRPHINPHSINRGLLGLGHSSEITFIIIVVFLLNYQLIINISKNTLFVIENIHLINWKSHKDSFIEFGKGTNLIVGIMGSGKSSIMDGISFALFGTFPQIESRRIKIRELFRQNSTEMKIELSLLLGDKRYKIIRLLKRNGEKHSVEAEISSNGKLIEKGNRAVSDYVEQLLKIDYSLFTRAIYSEQNSIDYFLSLNPKRRKEEFDGLLGLDRFEKVRSNLTTLINRLKIKVKTIAENFKESDIILLKDKKDGLEKKLFILKDKIKVFDEELIKLKPILSIAETELNKTILLEKEYFKLESEKKLILGRVEAYKGELSEVNFDDKSSEEKLNELNSKLNKIKSEHTELKSEIKNFEFEKNKLNNSILSESKSLSLLEVSLNRKKQLGGELAKSVSVDTLLSDISIINKKHIKLVEERVELEKLLGAYKYESDELLKIIDGADSINQGGIEYCPFCNTKLGVEKGKEILNSKKVRSHFLFFEIKKTNLSLSNIKENLVKLENEIGTKKSQLEKIKFIRLELGKINVNNEEVSLLVNNINKSKKEIIELNNKLSSGNISIEKLKTTISQIEHYVELIIKLKFYMNQIPLLEEKINNLNFKNVDKTKYESEITRLKISIEKLNGERNVSIGEQKHLSIELNECSSKIIKLENIENKIKKMRSSEEDLLKYKHIVEEVQISLRDDLIESINFAMNELWSMFYPYKDYTKLRIIIGEKDYNFEIYDDSWKRLDSVVSGGERACVALILRVALAVVLTPNLSWLMLDEPTHNLDRNAILQLSETLQNKVPEIIDQTIVITHEELLLGANFSNTYKLNRNKENLGPTKVEQI